MDAASQRQTRAAHMLSYATCWIMFGIFLCFPGIALTATGNASSYWYYDTSHSVMRTVGPILLVFGLILVISGIATCAHFRKTALRSAVTTQQPVVSGMAPSGGAYPPVGMAVQPMQGNYPGYPQQQPAQMGYQQQPGYPQPVVPQAGYPPQPYPPQATAPSQPYPPQATAPPIYGVRNDPPPSYEDMKR
ncbi:hypothetical protein LSAT2_031734 [Lamellibrachia satsuma]|nr:hypothetical protein LSAT2_031734 [Lamellibrachia satsuma]